MSVSYEELSNSPLIVRSRSAGFAATRQFKVAWSDVAAFLTLIDRDILPGTTWTLVSSIEVRPFDPQLAPEHEEQASPAAKHNSYSHALVTVQYEISYYDCAWPTDVQRPVYDDGTTLRLRISGSGQFLTLPGRSVKTKIAPADDAQILPPSRQARLLIPLADYRLTWDQVDNPPINKYTARLGHVNAAAFLSCEPETLLLESYDADHSFACRRGDPRTYKLEVVLKRRKIQVDAEVYGWNHTWQEKPPGWARQTMADDSPTYPTADFTSLFQQIP